MRDETETASAVALLMVFAHVLFLLDGLGPVFFSARCVDNWQGAVDALGAQRQGELYALGMACVQLAKTLFALRPNRAQKKKSGFPVPGKPRPPA